MYFYEDLRNDFSRHEEVQLIRLSAFSLYLNKDFFFPLQNFKTAPSCDEWRNIFKPFGAAHLAHQAKRNFLELIVGCWCNETNGSGELIKMLEKPSVFISLFDINKHQ
ncbi:CLUMA_CG013784, isoform A [Clunio marinus]|uniref:CLUMA_CG013784, isoform A n=1 Tax=Clunio marinus TaxID=568069 RepID=A0A1J1IJW4_9DIPT|nr:CLUMA_CG013784, isoform A [Clunio marinus]